MNFYYENSSHTLSQIQYGELLYNQMSHENIKNQGRGFISSTLPGLFKNFSGSQQVTKDIYLKRIEFTNGSLHFETEDRVDVNAYSNSASPQRLKSIELRSLNKNIKKIDFSYTYMNGGSSSLSKRLVLDQVQESFFESNQTTPKPPYKFTYNPMNLPEKTSYSIDHWGGYNGKRNDFIYEYKGINLEYYLDNNRSLTITNNYPKNRLKSLAPAFESPGENKVFIGGGNREVDIEKVQAGILTSIESPLGSITNFVYESNDYYSETETLFEDVNRSVFVNDGNEDVTFSLDDYTMVYMDISIDDDSENGIYNSNQLDMFLERQDTGIKIIKIKPSRLDDHSFETFFKAVLPPGTYKLRANYLNSTEMYLNFTLKYKTKASTRQKKGGGLRVHSITTLDSGNFAKKKTFQYDINETSTGRLVSPLKYFYNETLVNESVIPIPGNVIHYIYTADYLVRNSSSVIPLGNSAQGNAIGYDKVTIYNTDDEGVNLGRTEYFYRNEEEIPNENFLPGVPSFIHLNNGQLLSEISYNSQNKIVSIRDLKYEENQDVQISSKSVKLYSFFGSNSIGGVRFYDTFSKWWYLSEEHQTVYDEQGNAPITTKTYYEYNNEIHKNITRTTQTNSKNETLTVNRYYPDDIDHRTFLSGLEDSEYSALQRLKHGHAEHRINTLIQEESFVDNVLTSIQRTNFKTVNNVTLPKSIATGINTTTLEKRIHYYSYDSNGNPLEISKDQGPHIVYLWGYNETYPVAKIENATLAQVQSKLTNSELSNIRQGIYNTPALQTVLNKIRTGLPSAMVSTYTYDPLVGMISMTDPRGYTTYYEYDKFNRLSKVKDADGHIVNCNQYHYKE